METNKLAIDLLKFLSPYFPSKEKIKINSFLIDRDENDKTILDTLNGMMDNSFIHSITNLEDSLSNIENSDISTCMTGAGKFYLETEITSANQARLDNSILITNKLTWMNIFATIGFGIIVTITQLLTCNREKLRDYREERKLNRDSSGQEIQLRHDSLYENKVVHILEDIRDSLPNLKITTKHK